MTDFQALESSRPELEIMLVEIIAMVLGEEATPVHRPLPDVLLANSRLIIHDESDDSYLGVEVRAEATLATVLAESLLGVTEPAPEDVLDVIAELGNIAAGNVKSLLCTNGRLSLPAPVLAEQSPTDPAGTVRAVAVLFGRIVELVVIPVSGVDAATRWPGFASV